jgi:hypothetical protein
MTILHRPTYRTASLVLTLAIVELTLTTAYIHLSLGGMLFTLNAIGYTVLALGLLVAVASPIGRFARLAWLPRLGLAAYTLTTIGAYLVMGPYFDLGWITKAVEVAILTLLAASVVIDWSAEGRPHRGRTRATTLGRERSIRIPEYRRRVG